MVQRCLEQGEGVFYQIFFVAFSLFVVAGRGVLGRLGAASAVEESGCVGSRPHSTALDVRSL